VPPNWPFTKENRLLISEVSEWLKLHTSDCKGISLAAMWQFFMAWSITQRAARETAWSFPKEEPQGIFKVSEAVYYSKYAVAVYGKLLVNLYMEEQFADLVRNVPAIEILATYSGIPVEDIPFISAESQLFNPAHAICIDRSKMTVILAVRGTLSVIDCITDLKAEYLPYVMLDPSTRQVKARGEVHEGIYKGAQSIYYSTKDKLLSALAANPGYDLIVTGHSLGAGTAGLIGLLWLSDPDFASLNFRAYCYGSPCVVSPELHPYLKLNVMTVSLGTDIITRSCFGSIKDLVKVLTFLREREGRTGVLTASLIINRTLTSQSIDRTELVNLYNAVKQGFTNPKHLPPGCIYQIYDKQRNPDYRLLPESDHQFTGEFAASSFYEEVVFSRTTLTDHMPDMYEKALKGLKLEE
jgi:hypothetical protein